MFGKSKIGTYPGVKKAAAIGCLVVPIAFALSWAFTRSAISFQFSQTLQAIEAVRGFQGLVLDGGGVSQLAVNLSERTSDWYIWKFQAKEVGQGGQEISRVFAPGPAFAPTAWPFSVAVQGAVAGYLLNVALLPPRSLLLQLALLSLCIGGLCTAGLFAWSQWHERSLQLAIANAVRVLAIQVSHDVRSPLSAIKVLSSAKSLPQEMRELATLAVSRMLSLTDSLSIQRLEENESLRRSGAPLDPKPIAVIPLLQEAIREKEMEYSLGPSVGLQLIIAPTAGEPQVHVNAAELRRIISNLLNNAVEAGDDRRRPIQIEVSVRQSVVWIEIVDHGKGISPDLARSFGKAPITQGKAKGSGLGLYHAFRTVKTWRGKISLGPGAEGGTRVALQLPLSVLL